jgi:hypothetical protein
MKNELDNTHIPYTGSILVSIKGPGRASYTILTENVKHVGHKNCVVVVVSVVRNHMCTLKVKSPISSKMLPKCIKISTGEIRSTHMHKAFDSGNGIIIGTGYYLAQPRKEIVTRYTVAIFGHVADSHSLRGGLVKSSLRD